jgi:hypothetical protein
MQGGAPEDGSFDETIVIRAAWMQRGPCWIGIEVNAGSGGFAAGKTKL